MCRPGSLSQAEGVEFKPQGWHPKFALDGYSFIPKTCRLNAFKNRRKKTITVKLQIKDIVD